ncbi:MAG: transglutaminase domain-containing protein [Planctomycetota bacterium]
MSRTPDLTPFVGRGFAPEIDRIIANTPVRGIDRLLSCGKIRLAAETEEYLYSEYTPTRVRCRTGSRPRLEAIAAEVLGDPPRTDRAAVRKLVSWVPANVRHAAGADPAPPDRALPEEDIIASGWGWCNEQARVLAALAQTAGMPGRLVGIYSVDPPRGHMSTELYVESKWSWACPTHGCVVTLPDGTWASAAEIWKGPAVRALFAVEWERAVNAWNKEYGEPPLEGDPAARFDRAGIVNYFISSYGGTA